MVDAGPAGAFTMGCPCGSQAIHACFLMPSLSCWASLYSLYSSFLIYRKELTTQGGAGHPGSMCGVLSLGVTLL